jgi:hypothetical protein
MNDDDLDDLWERCRAFAPPTMTKEQFIAGTRIIEGIASLPEDEQADTISRIATAIRGASKAAC